jgi:hypothetical protein
LGKNTINSLFYNPVYDLFLKLIFITYFYGYLGFPTLNLQLNKFLQLNPPGLSMRILYCVLAPAKVIQLVNSSSAPWSPSDYFGEEGYNGDEFGIESDFLCDDKGVFINGFTSSSIQTNGLDIDLSLEKMKEIRKAHENLEDFEKTTTPLSNSFNIATAFGKVTETCETRKSVENSGKNIISLLDSPAPKGINTEEFFKKMRENYEARSSREAREDAESLRIRESLLNDFESSKPAEHRPKYLNHKGLLKKLDSAPQGDVLLVLPPPSFASPKPPSGVKLPSSHESQVPLLPNRSVSLESPIVNVPKTSEASSESSESKPSLLNTPVTPKASSESKPPLLNTPVMPKAPSESKPWMIRHQTLRKTSKDRNPDLENKATSPELSLSQASMTPKKPSKDAIPSPLPIETRTMGPQQLPKDCPPVASLSQTNGNPTTINLTTDHCEKLTKSATVLWPTRQKTPIKPNLTNHKFERLQYFGIYDLFAGQKSLSVHKDRVFPDYF